MNLITKTGWVEAHNPAIALSGEVILGKEIVLPKVSEFLSEEPKLEDYGSFES